MAKRPSHPALKRLFRYFVGLCFLGWIARFEAQTPSHHAATSATMPGKDVAALHSALDAYDRGDLTRAEPALRDLVDRYPGSYDANEALGSLYAEQGNFGSAYPYLHHACQLAPRESLAWANLGATLLKDGNVAESIAALSKSVALDPKNATTQTNLGQALMAAKRPADAARAFRAAVEEQPQNWDLHYNLGLALFESGEARQAANVLAKIPEISRSEQMHLLAGDVDEKTGDFKSALTHYQAAARIDPSDSNLYLLTAELLRHWTWDEAIQVADYGARLYPGSAHFKAAKGIALYGSNKYPEAVEIFSGLLAQDSENDLYADLLGRSCALIVEGASTGCNSLDSFAERHPGNARAAMYAATSMLHRPTAEQDTAKADALLHQAIAADPKLPEAYYELGVLEQQRSQWQESAVALEKATALRPNYAEAHYRLSRAYSHLGRRDEAQKEIALQQAYVRQEKDHLDARMQEVVTFLIKSN